MIDFEGEREKEKRKKKDDGKKLLTTWLNSWLVLYPRNSLGLTILTRSLGRVA